MLHGQDLTFVRAGWEQLLEDFSKSECRLRKRESTDQKPTRAQADKHSILSTLACSPLNVIQSIQSYTQLLNEITKPLA